MKRTILTTVAMAGALALGACGKTVPSGYVGVKVRTLFNAGIDPVPLAQGWHMTGWGEEIHVYPTLQRLYPYTRDADDRGPENEEMSFNDSRGLPMTADIQIQAATTAACVPELYRTWRSEFDELISGPIRNDFLSALSAETEKTTVEELYSGARQAVIAQALKPVAEKWSKSCVTISQAGWVGPIRYPESIVESINRKTLTDQATQNAEALVRQKTAEANSLIEEAKGIAEKTRLEGEALRANPEVLRRQWIEKWDGKLPTYMLGADADVMMMLPSK